MKLRLDSKRVAIAVVMAVGVCMPTTSFAALKCTLHFRLSGWSAFYKTARGSGKITCDNGHYAHVTLHVTGGGLTFGTTKIVNGKGTFSDVETIHELFGNYATADVHAGAGASSDAQVLTKGPVSLALAGTGQGINIGFDFGKFTIQGHPKP